MCSPVGDADGLVPFFRDGVALLRVLLFCRLFFAPGWLNAADLRTEDRSRFLLLPCSMLFARSFVPVFTLFTVVKP